VRVRVTGSLVVVPISQQRFARAPRRIDFDAAYSPRNFGDAGGRRGSFWAAIVSWSTGGPLLHAGKMAAASEWRIPDPRSDARCRDIASLRYAAGDLRCACAERRAIRGS